MKSRFVLQDGRTELVFLPESEWEKAALHQMTALEVKSAKWVVLVEEKTFSDRLDPATHTYEMERRNYLEPFPTKPSPNAMVVVLGEPEATDAPQSEKFAGVVGKVPYPSTAVQTSP